MQGCKNYQEKLFTTFHLSDRVPVDNFYRRLNSILDLSFVYEATSKYYGKEGNPGIDPVVFFKFILVGYFENLQTDRKIIENSRLRLDLLYFIGYDIDEELPWHSTISRTRQLYGEEVFVQLFKEVLVQCIEKGMVSGKRQAIDSVLVKANASMDSLSKKKIIEDGIQYIANLNKEEDIIIKLPVKTKKEKPVKMSNKTRMSLTDPDARVATKPGKATNLNYLGQVSVDTAHHVITNIEAHHADKRDSQCLSSVLGHTVKNLALLAIEVKEVLADGNYSSAEALKAAIENNVTAYIPNLGTYKNEREGFTYNPEGDYYQCGRGIKLSLKRIAKRTKTAQPMKYYNTLVKDCKDCPLKTTCISKGNIKTLVHSVYKPLYDEMHWRMICHYGKQMRRLRQSTVEPVIGTLVSFLGMKRVNGRGQVLATNT